MQYISTRGGGDKINFANVLTSNLAAKGGLFMPESIPNFSKQDIEAMRDLSYTELTY